MSDLDKNKKRDGESEQPSSFIKHLDSPILEPGPINAFDSRPAYYKTVDRKNWEDWQWQQKRAVRNVNDLQYVFPSFDESQIVLADAWDNRNHRFLITPYILALVEKDELGNPLPTDPIWRQFFPSFEELMQIRPRPSIAEFDPESPEDNWEYKGEMLSPIAQNKYPNRVLIHTSDKCMSNCMYCFRSIQTEAPRKKHGGLPHWADTMKALAQRPDIQEVIISGGEPLLYDDEKLEKMFKDVRSIPSIRHIRIHTRALTANPYRITDNFCQLLKEYGITVLTMHVCHPNELTQEMRDAVKRIRESGSMTMLLSQTVLIKRVNDDVETLRRLYNGLFGLSVHAHYLFHAMPGIPAAESQRTSVRRGAEIMEELRTKISPPVTPEYIIADRTGKKPVPRDIKGAPDFRYSSDSTGTPLILFRNWKGNDCQYLDGTDDVYSDDSVDLKDNEGSA